MDKPILMIGILLMSVYLLTYQRHLFFGDKDRFNPTSCKAVLVKLNRRIPGNWSTNCRGNNLEVSIQYQEIQKPGSKKQKVRKLLYREMANFLTYIATNSPLDNLEQVDVVSVYLHHPKILVTAVTEGKYIVKLSTIKNKQMIANHLKATVSVKETIKDKKAFK